jgi:taurine dioxygenase
MGGWSAIDIVPLTTHVGAEIHGLDLTADHRDDAALEALRDAWLRHHVVFVPGQHLGPRDLLDIAGWFGEILRNPLSPKVDGFPDVTELVARDGHAPDIWHFDTSYHEAPPKASLFTMVKTPPVGGDTLWLSTAAVYDSLSEPMRTLCEGLHVRYRSTFGNPDILEAVHPLVRVHPETGRRCLYFDPLYSVRVVELHRAESDALLSFLRVYVTDPTFACRYRWTEGAFAMWDNRCTLHRVASDFVGERIIHRVTIADDAPVGLSVDA